MPAAAIATAASNLNASDFIFLLLEVEKTNGPAQRYTFHGGCANSTEKMSTLVRTHFKSETLDRLDFIEIYENLTPVICREMSATVNLIRQWSLP
jgi:hypothetical protein